MINGFCRKGYPCSLQESTAGIEQYTASRIRQVREEGGEVIFIGDSHSLSDPEIGHPYKPHCMEGTVEAEIVDTLKPLAERSIVLKKNTLSIFLNTALEQLLEQFNPQEVEVIGVCTDISDLFAIFELKIRGYEVVISEKGLLSLEPGKQVEDLEYFRNRLGVSVRR
jgi:nicotinamidase-related amidase